MIDSYLLGEVCMYKLKNNVDIRKYLQLAGLKRSSKEERATERYKNTYLTSIQRKYGSSITNISQVEEVHNKKVGTAIRNYGSYENYLKIHRTYMKVGYKEFIQDNDRVKKQFDKCKSTCLRKYGNANFGQGKEAKAKAAKTKKEIIATWSYQERLARSSKARAKVCNRGGYESSIERRVQDILTFLGIPFEKHFHMWHYNYDLLVFNNVIIEVQGDMWHANPKRYKSTDIIMGKLIAQDIWDKDARKKKVAEDNGFSIIYIWEYEIRKVSDIKLTELIKSRLGI
jgi:G:T-mismatch repair DNA endonuclease (very short patch repair protein)